MPATSETLCEHIDSRGLSLQVDREHGVIRGVKIVGTDSKKGRVYPIEVLRKAAGLYEGKAVNIDHVDDGQRRSYADRIGRLQGVQTRPDGLYGDLHFNPKHILAEQLAWDAEHAPENLGLSHDARGVIVRRGGKLIVEEIEQVVSVDLVANPATTNGLFESVEPEKPETRTMSATLQEATVETLRRERADLVESIKRDIAESAEAKAREAEIKTLREENERLKADNAKHARRAVIQEELRSAKIDTNDRAACSDLFMESLLNEPDAARRKALTEDRLALVGSRRDPAGSTAPQSQSRYVTEGRQEERSVERAVASWTD